MQDDVEITELQDDLVFVKDDPMFCFFLVFALIN